LIAVVSPQESRQLVAQVSLSRLDDEKRQQRLGLLAAEHRRRPGSQPSLKASEKSQVQQRHGLLVCPATGDLNTNHAAIAGKKTDPMLL